MLSKASGLSRAQILAHPEKGVSTEAVERFSEWVIRRSTREPLAYILGEKEFYSLCFEVTPAVIIPRPETEILVETALSIVKQKRHPVVADIGLGSGAVAISIAKNLQDGLVYGTEVSAEALEVARRNAERMGVCDWVCFLQGDLFEPLEDRSFDLIVSNPPYIPSGEIDCLEPEISKYEPRGALDGGPDGLDYFRRIATSAPEHVRPGGALALEVGMGQAESVRTLLSAAGFNNPRSIKDYAGIERVVVASKEPA
jgi:release factor glutamine methyltransferase